MEAMERRIGWIGCGKMGTAMVSRFVDAGMGVTLTNRTRSKADALASEGVRVVDQAIELADCDIVFIMVGTDQDVQDVTIGSFGVLANPVVAPKILVDCSTISAETSASVRAACAARGVSFLAAPVSGNPKVVASGQLTLAVSGDRDAFDQAQSLLNLLGHGVTYVGEGEVARLVKICHNMFLGAMIQSLAEILVLGERGGIKRSALLEFLNNSIVGSPFTRYKTPALVNLDFTPTFTTTMLRKDFDLGMAVARNTRVSMPVTGLCTELVASAIGAGLGDRDFAVLLAEQARSAGLEMRSEEARVGDGLGTTVGN